jgi:hypothetical protein
MTIGSKPYPPLAPSSRLGRATYNEQRPHSALGYRTPAEFAAAHRHNANERSTEDSH